jgi:hypothetical protein
MSTTKKVKTKKSKKQKVFTGSRKIERGIYRVSYPKQNGIRVYLKFRDKVFQKVFTIGRGGERSALARARRWRKERLKEIQNLPEAASPLRPLQSNNKSGIIGVRRGRTVWGDTWNATWVENGKGFHRSFAVAKYGEQEARRLACKARAEAEKRIYGQIFQDALKNLP